MTDEISFSLEQMENVYLEAYGYYDIFKNSIDEIDLSIESLGKIWTSNETGTYEQFKQMYKEKYPTLVEAKDMMEQFINVLNQKKEDFQQAANDTISSFE